LSAAAVVKMFRTSCDVKSLIEIRSLRAKSFSSKNVQ
jgi:hypothetical protein